MLIVDKNRPVGLLNNNNLEKTDVVIVIDDDHFHYLKNRFAPEMNDDNKFSMSKFFEHIEMIHVWNKCRQEMRELFEGVKNE